MRKKLGWIGAITVLVAAVLWFAARPTDELAAIYALHPGVEPAPDVRSYSRHPDTRFWFEQSPGVVKAAVPGKRLGTHSERGTDTTDTVTDVQLPSGRTAHIEVMESPNFRYPMCTLILDYDRRNWLQIALWNIRHRLGLD